MIEKLKTQIMKKATFNVVFPTNYVFGSTSNELEASYVLEYSTATDLHELWQEARRVWSEFVVEVDTHSFIMVNETPYAEEVMAELTQN
jgi:hypothetical protein